MTDCPNCPRAKQLCQEVAQELKMKFEVKDMQEHMVDACQLNFMTVPTIVLGDSVLFKSHVPDKNELITEIKKQKESGNE